MAFTVGATLAKDSAGTAIPGGLLSADVAGGGVGPTFLFHGLVDGIAGVNKSQIDSSSRLAVHIGAAATAIAKAEDVASADADVGVGALAVRKATPANTSGTDGDYEFLQMSAGRLWTNSLLGDGTNAVAVKAASTAPGATDPSLVVAISPNSINANGSATSANSAPVVIASDQGWPVSTIGFMKKEDVASADGDAGIPALAVQKATPANTAGTDGDYEFLQMSAGRLWTSSIITAAATSIGKAEDVASADADVGVPAMAVRKATPANSSGTDGDWEFLQISAGLLWTDAQSHGDVAHDGVDSGNPVKTGSKATTSLSALTLVSSGDRTDRFAGVDGVQIMRPHTNLEDIVSGVLANTDGASTAVIAAQSAGIKTYITTVIFANTSATAVTVDLRDGAAGTVKATFPVPANTSGVVCNLPVPLGFSAATAVCMDGSAAASTVTCTLIGFKSKV